MTQHLRVLWYVCTSIYLPLMQILNDLSTKVKAFVYLLLPLEFSDNQFVYFILCVQNTVIIIVTASVVLCATCAVERCLPRKSGTWPVLD
jgi:hypothetical protein